MSDIKDNGIKKKPPEPLKKREQIRESYIPRPPQRPAEKPQRPSTPTQPAEKPIKKTN